MEAWTELKAGTDTSEVRRAEIDGREEEEIIRVNVTPAYHITAALCDTPGGQCGIYTHTHTHTSP